MSYKPVPAMGKDWLTPFFDVLIEIFGASFREKVLERVHVQNGERLLDVGCGTASLLITVKARYPQAQMVGIDADEKILERARKHIHNKKVQVEVLRARAENLPFPPSSFDVVVSTLTFHHLPTEVKKQAMKEIHRMLTPGGRFLLADFGRPEGMVLKLLFALVKVLPSDEAKYIQDNKEGKLPLFLEEAGFQVQEIPPRYKGIPFLLATKE